MPDDAGSTQFRFSATYELPGPESTARMMAEALCTDSTVEMPAGLLPAPIRESGLLGRLQALTRLAADRFLVDISFPGELLGESCAQLLHTLFGISSLKSGIRLHRLTLPEALPAEWPGARFGIAGLRRRLGIDGRPLICGVLKPLGATPAQLAETAYRLAVGGLDLIKDDQTLGHGDIGRFEERVSRCADAVDRANRETGGATVYIAAISGSADDVLRRSLRANELGAGGLLVCPGLSGFDVLRLLSRHPALTLPLFSHPALLGTYALHPHQGLAPGFLFGQLPRLAGADVTIYPHFGGAYGLTAQDCRQIADCATAPWGALTPVFPTAAGQISLSRLRPVREFYGDHVVVILGSELYREPDSVRDLCRAVKERQDAPR